MAYKVPKAEAAPWLARPLFRGLVLGMMAARPLPSDTRIKKNRWRECASGFDIGRFFMLVRTISLPLSWHVLFLNTDFGQD